MVETQLEKKTLDIQYNQPTTCLLDSVQHEPNLTILEVRYPKSDTEKQKHEELSEE